MKNILIIITKLYGGGAERIAARLSCAFGKKHKVYLALFRDDSIVYPYKGEIITLKQHKPTSPYNYIAKLFRLIQRVQEIKKIKREKNIDVSISLLEAPNIVNVLARENDRVILSIRTFTTKILRNRGFFGKVLGFFIKNFYNSSDWVVPVSKVMGKDLIENYNIKPDRIKVVYNFVNTEEIRKNAEESIAGYEEVFKSPVIINVSRLHKQKGQKNLIKVFKNVKNQIPEAKLVILGEGELKQELVTYTEELGLTVNFDVYFPGFQQNPYKFLARADIFAFPSTLEGMPNVILEAMACNLPIISSDCRSGPREILAPDTDPVYQAQKPEFAKYGVLMPVMEEENLKEKEAAWTEILVKFLCDKQLRNKYTGFSQQRIQDFQEESIVKQWERLF